MLASVLSLPVASSFRARPRVQWRPTLSTCRHRALWGSEQEANPWEEFTTPGSSYYVDMEAVGELVYDYRRAERRWETDGGRSRKVGVLDDKGSLLHAWWYGPDGPEAMSQTRQAAMQLKRRMMRVLRPTVVASIAAFAIVAPARAARTSLRLGVTIHVLLPTFRLLIASASTALDRDGARLHFADATQIFAAQHMLGAIAILPTSAMLWFGGAWFEALVVGALGRLCLLPGLWHWGDLNEELIQTNPAPITRSGEVGGNAARMRAATRVWRLLATSLCIGEAVLLAQIAIGLDAVFVAAPATFAEGGAAAVLSTLAPPLSDTARALTARNGPLLLGLTSGLASYLGLSAQAAGAAALLCGRLCTVLIVSYAMWWLAFPVEAATRSHWRAQLTPKKRDGVATLSSAMLRTLRIGKASPTVADLLRRKEMIRDGDSASEKADGMLYLSALGPEDFIRGDEWSSDGFEGPRIMPVGSGLGEALVRSNTSKSLAQTVSRFEDGWEERWAFNELGRLLLAEDFPTAKGHADAIPDGRRWVRDEAQRGLVELFERETRIGAVEFGDGDQKNTVALNQTSSTLAEYLYMKKSLEYWAEDPPEGYELPEIVGWEEMEKEQAMRKAAMKSGGASNERRAVTTDGMVASDDGSAGDIEGLGGAATPAPEGFVIPEPDEGEFV
jgi:hypothetical protein